MPTQLKQVISSFLTWSAYEKLAMSMTWQISPGAVLLQLPYTTQSALECSWGFFLVAVFSKDGVLKSEWGLMIHLEVFNTSRGPIHRYLKLCLTYSTCIYNCLQHNGDDSLKKPKYAATTKVYQAGVITICVNITAGHLD
jgi:hypothetical protein